MFWLLASFLLGVAALILDVTEGSPQDPDSEAGSWSFGQTMPVILLTVPFITIVENLYSDEAPVCDFYTEARDVSYSPPLLPRLEEQHNEDKGLLAFNPDRDYYNVSSSMKSGTVCIVILEIVLACIILVSIVKAPTAMKQVAAGNMVLSVFYHRNITVFSGMAILAFFSLWCIILFSLSIDWAVSQKAGRRYVPKQLLLVLLQLVNITLFTAFLAGLIFIPF